MRDDFADRPDRLLRAIRAEHTHLHTFESCAHRAKPPIFQRWRIHCHRAGGLRKPIANDYGQSEALLEALLNLDGQRCRSRAREA